MVIPCSCSQIVRFLYYVISAISLVHCNYQSQGFLIWGFVFKFVPQVPPGGAIWTWQNTAAGADFLFWNMHLFGSTKGEQSSPDFFQSWIVNFNFLIVVRMLLTLYWLELGLTSLLIVFIIESYFLSVAARWVDIRGRNAVWFLCSGLPQDSFLWRSPLAMRPILWPL